MDSASPRIAIVDDDEGVRRALRRLMLSLSYEPTVFASGEDFLGSLGTSRPRCVIMDLHLPGLRGIDVLEQLRSDGYAFPVIVVTGLDLEGMREKCLGAGASAYMTKPIERSDISAALREALVAM